MHNDSQMNNTMQKVTNNIYDLWIKKKVVIYNSIIKYKIEVLWIEDFIYNGTYIICSYRIIFKCFYARETHALKEKWSHFDLKS